MDKKSPPKIHASEYSAGWSQFSYFFIPVITEGFSIHILEFYYHLGTTQLHKVKFIFTWIPKEFQKNSPSFPQHRCFTTAQLWPLTRVQCTHVFGIQLTHGKVISKEFNWVLSVPILSFNQLNCVQPIIHFHRQI